MKNQKLLLFAAAVAPACIAPALRASDEQKPASPARPNILLICADDLGWADLGCYGSEVKTPNLDALAKNGIRFTSFHNTSKCFPSRACLLTGLYAQQVGYAKTWNHSFLNSITLGEMLKSAGYVTLWSGKHHSTENPVTRGFDHFYGFLAGGSNYFNPGNQREGEGVPAKGRNEHPTWCVDDRPFESFTPPKDFYTTDYFTKHALQWLDDYKDSEKPIFLYMAYNAPHSPLMAWPDDIAKYEGKYKAGYEAIRKARYEKQLQMGLIDKHFKLSVPTYQPWNELSPAKRAEEERKMAVYAAMIDRMDQNIGKILDKLRAQGKLDNTLVIFVSDNGASAEQGPVSGFGEIGTLTNWSFLGRNWANVCNTPFRYYKMYSYEGGIATPLIISWPDGLKNPGRISGFTGHFIDIMPTLVELSGADYPAKYKGKPVLPCEGISLMPIVRDEQEPRRAKPLYWEWANGQGMRDGQWKLVRQGLKNKWSLFDIVADPSETNDLAAKNPAQVDAMKKTFEAWQQLVAKQQPNPQPAGRKQSGKKQANNNDREYDN